MALGNLGTAFLEGWRVADYSQNSEQARRIAEAEEQRRQELFYRDQAEHSEKLRLRKAQGVARELQFAMTGPDGSVLPEEEITQSPQRRQSLLRIANDPMFRDLLEGQFGAGAVTTDAEAAPGGKLRFYVSRADGATDYTDVDTEELLFGITGRLARDVPQLADYFHQQYKAGKIGDAQLDLLGGVVRREPGTPSVSPRNTPQNYRGQYDDLVATASAKYGVPEALIHSTIAAESSYDPEAVSSAGAQGLMQLMPGTARRFNVADPFDPAQSIDGGTRYLKVLLDRYNGDVRKASAAYNAGEGTVDKVGGVPQNSETPKYVDRVMRGVEQYSARNAAPIDPNKPQIRNPDGSVSTERSITIEVDGRYVNIPTIVQGRAYSPNEAVRLFERGVTQPLGVFNSLPEAEAAAQARSDEIGRRLETQETPAVIRLLEAVPGVGPLAPIGAAAQGAANYLRRSYDGLPPPPPRRGLEALDAMNERAQQAKDKYLSTLGPLDADRVRDRDWAESQARQEEAMTANEARGAGVTRADFERSGLPGSEQASSPLTVRIKYQDARRAATTVRAAAKSEEPMSDLQRKAVMTLVKYGAMTLDDGARILETGRVRKRDLQLLNMGLGHVLAHDKDTGEMSFLRDPSFVSDYALTHPTKLTAGGKSKGSARDVQLSRNDLLEKLAYTYYPGTTKDNVQERAAQASSVLGYTLSALGMDSTVANNSETAQALLLDAAKRQRQMEEADAGWLKDNTKFESSLIPGYLSALYNIPPEKFLNGYVKPAIAAGATSDVAIARFVPIMIGLQDTGLKGSELIRTATELATSPVAKQIPVTRLREAATYAETGIRKRQIEDLEPGLAEAEPQGEYEEEEGDGY